MSTEVRYQFFISSTYVDLEQERKKVSDLILELNHIPAGMELFSADNEEQWDTIQKVILNSDYYILIIGNRYGSIEAASGMSYTEKEYHFALENKIPILAFIADKDYSVSLDKSPREDEVSYQKLSEFKNNVKSTRMIQFWTNKDDLTLKIMGSIVKAISKYDRPGWIRGNSANSDMKDKLLQYMEENNKLKEELEKYQLIEKDSGLDFFIENDFGSFRIGSDIKEPILVNRNDSKAVVNLHSEQIKCLSESDFPEHLSKYVTTSEIDEYNISVPTYRDSLDEFERKLQAYKLMKPFSGFKVNIINNKTIKLNSIAIIIEFPDLFKVEKNNEEIVEPKRPNIPNLLTEVENRCRFPEMAFIREQTRMFDGFKRIDLPHFESGINLSSFDTNMNSIFDSIKIDNNIVNINLKKIRQDTMETIDDEGDLIIYPVKEGCAEISIKMICDEYSRWTEIKVPVTVTFN